MNSYIFIPQRASGLFNFGCFYIHGDIGCYEVDGAEPEPVLMRIGGCGVWRERDFEVKKDFFSYINRFAGSESLCSLRI